MPVPPPGYNLQYFSPQHPNENLVTKVTASSSEYTSKIAFNVSNSHQHIVKQCLNDVGVMAQVWNTEAHGTWLSVFGMRDVKKSLNGLHAKKLMNDDFYQQIVKHFPKAHGGSLDLSSIEATSTDLDLSSGINNTKILQLLQSVKKNLKLQDLTITVERQLIYKQIDQRKDTIENQGRWNFRV